MSSNDECGRSRQPSLEATRTGHAPDRPGGPLVVPAPVLDEARMLFEDCGSRGHEGTALLAAGGVDGVRLVAPSQTATSAVGGASVWVDRAGQLELIAALRAGETYRCRIHSHPLQAFHSAADDANPVLTHRGALSIVVPFFGLALRRGLDACAVLRFDGTRWHDLPPGRLRDRWLHTDVPEDPR